MKKLYLIVLAIMYTSLVNSQNLDSVLLESKNTGVWENNVNTSYTYNEDGNMLTWLTKKWESNSESWLNLYLGENAINSDGTVDSTLFKEWNGTGWDNFDKRNYHYTSTGKVDTFTVQDYGAGGWINNIRTIYEYDINDYNIYRLEQISFGGWKNSRQNFITNNVEGLPIELIQERWNISSNDWEKNYKEGYTYNNSGLIIEVLREDWVEPTWVNFRKTTTSYNSTGLITFVQGLKWDIQTDSWVVIEEGSYSYNSDFTQMQIVGSDVDFNTGTPEEKGRLTYYYSAPLDLFEGQNPLISLYPNPVNNLVIIDFNTASSTNISLVDLSGRVLQTIEVEDGQKRYQLDISKYPSGMYFIQVHLDGILLQSEKLIIE